MNGFTDAALEREECVTVHSIHRFYANAPIPSSVLCTSSNYHSKPVHLVALMIRFLRIRHSAHT